MGLQTVKEISALLGVTEKTVYRWIYRYPQFPCMRVERGDYRIDFEVLIGWMKSSPSMAGFVKNCRME